MSDIDYDSEGCETRSTDGSDSEDSLRSFIDADSDELEDIEESNVIYTKRVSTQPSRFADQVYISETEEETSEEECSEEDV